MGVDYENLGGRGKAANVVELINWAKRNNRVSELLALVKEARPHKPDVVALLPPHHILYRRNELFTGREEWLSQLHDALHRDEPVAVTQAVAGLGGVGKTQLALAYCYRHLNDYDLIQWLHTTDKHWLLVYDNADAIQPKELRPFLPKLGHGACLITSRNPNWGGLAQTLQLTHFNETEAVAFLLGQPAMTSEEIAAQRQRQPPQRLRQSRRFFPFFLSPLLPRPPALQKKRNHLVQTKQPQRQHPSSPP